MGRTRIHKDLKEKQKAYRERKKGLGYRQISVIVPESIYGEIEGNPGLLVEAYIKVRKRRRGKTEK